MPSHILLAVILGIIAAHPDETLRRYGAADREWHLVTLNDRAFQGTATLTFPARGQIIGSGPCNRFTSSNTTPYPWIEIGPIAATRSACPDLTLEHAYFEALRAARIVVIEDDTMTLSDEDTPLLVFKARD